MIRCWLPLLLIASRAFSAPHDYLTARELERVREWMPVYRRTADQVLVPVLALPAIQYRESDLLDTWTVLPEEAVILRHRRNIPYRNIGGPFMLDLGADGDPKGFDKRIREFETTVALWYRVSPVPRVRDNFPFSCLCAAVELRDKVKGNLVDQEGRTNRALLAEALWAYNGKAAWQKTWRQSACVWNDPKRGRVLMQVSDARERKMFPDSRPGSLVVYDELKRRL